MKLSNSQIYFEISQNIKLLTRREIFKIFLSFPFALLSKLWKTAMRALGVLLCGFFLILTLGMSQGLRSLFVEKMTKFAANLADWLFFPFAVIRFLFALTLYFLNQPVQKPLVRPANKS